MAKIFRKISFSSQGWVLLALFLLILPTIFPLFQPHVSGTADGLGHRFRLVSFYNALKEGIVRPRWAKEAALGYGAPIFFFNYPLPYYMASFFLKVGFSVNQAGQLFSALCLLASSVFMYLLGKKIAGPLGGFTAAVVYTYAPYHLQMTYLYDSWGEELAFVFPPLITYLTFATQSVILIPTKSGEGPHTQNVGKRDSSHFALLTIAWFLFILSHNVSAIMFSPILLVLALVVSHGNIRGFLLIVNAFVLAVLISSFFWLPAWVMQGQMEYPQFLAGEGAIRGTFFKSFSFQLETAFRVVKDGVAHYLDFTIGLPILVAGIMGLFYLLNFHFPWMLKKKEQIFFYWVIGLLVLLLFSLYLTNNASSWFWNFPPLTYVLYPFRFLFVASFFGALLTGIMAKKHWLVGLTLIVLAVMQGKPYTNPYTEIFPFDGSYFKQRQTITSAPFTRKNMLIKEFLPVKTSFQFLEQEERRYLEAYFKGEITQSKEISILKGEAVLGKIESETEKVSTVVEAKTPATILFSRLFFPNWEVFVDGGKYSLIVDEVGRMKTEIPSGSHELQFVFGTTNIEEIANMVSLVGILIFVGEALFLPGLTYFSVIAMTI